MCPGLHMCAYDICYVITNDIHDIMHNCKHLWCYRWTYDVQHCICVHMTYAMSWRMMSCFAHVCIWHMLCHDGWCPELHICGYDICFVMTGSIAYVCIWHMLCYDGWCPALQMCAYDICYVMTDDALNCIYVHITYALSWRMMSCIAYVRIWHMLVCHDGWCPTFHMCAYDLCFVMTYDVLRCICGHMT